MLNRFHFELAFSFIYVFCVSAQAEVRYTVTDIGTIPGTTSSQAVSINNNNQIAGFCDGWEIAFFWENGVFTDIGGFGGNHNRPKAINDNGQITGVSAYPSGSGFPSAFLWQSGDSIFDIGSLFNNGSYGYDINNDAKIVGQCYQPGVGEHAFVWQNNVMTDLGRGIAIAISNAGLIAGISEEVEVYGHAVIWDNDSIVDLGVFGGFHPEPHDINDSGQVIIFSHSFNDGLSIYNAAFLWDHGVEINLGILAGFRNSQPYGINNSCQIVGQSYDSLSQNGPESAAFLWEHGTMYNLNELVSSDSEWILLEANGINDSGYIVGYGYNPDGNMRGFLLEPIPEPATLSFTLLGGIALMKRRR